LAGAGLLRGNQGESDGGDEGEERRLVSFVVLVGWITLLWFQLRKEDYVPDAFQAARHGANNSPNIKDRFCGFGFQLRALPVIACPRSESDPVRSRPSFLEITSIRRPAATDAGHRRDDRRRDSSSIVGETTTHGQVRSFRTGGGVKAHQEDAEPLDYIPIPSRRTRWLIAVTARHLSHHANDGRIWSSFTSLSARTEQQPFAGLQFQAVRPAVQPAPAPFSCRQFPSGGNVVNFLG
jgi:hypothetical protein